MGAGAEVGAKVLGQAPAVAVGAGGQVIQGDGLLQAVIHVLAGTTGGGVVVGLP